MTNNDVLLVTISIISIIMGHQWDRPAQSFRGLPVSHQGNMQVRERERERERKEREKGASYQLTDNAMEIMLAK